MNHRLSGEIYQRPTGAAQQYAEAIFNVIKFRDDSERSSYWGTKLRLLKTTHQIPDEYHMALFGDEVKPSLDKIFDSVETGGFRIEPGKVPTLLVWIACSAIAQIPEPTRGVLAISGNRTETSAWSREINKVSKSVDEYEAATLDLLAGQLTASVPQLAGAEISQASLVGRGLPEEPPGPVWEDW